MAEIKDTRRLCGISPTRRSDNNCPCRYQYIPPPFSNVAQNEVETAQGRKGDSMILVIKKLSLATLVLFSVAAIPGLAQSQTCTDCAGAAVSTQIAEVGSGYTDVAPEYTEFDSGDAGFDSQYAGIGETGGYFEHAATCGCQRCGRTCGKRSGRLRSIARALRPFGDSSGFDSYRSVFGGWAELEDEGGNIFFDGLEFNDGFVLGAAKGIYLNDNVRIERESSWRNNTVESLPATTVDFGLDGRVNNFSSMVNVVREFRADNRVRPYAGLGIGASRQDGEFDVVDFVGTELELDDWAFAYQGFVGLRFINSSRVSLFAEYRYFGNSETNLEVSTNGGPRVDLSDFEYTSENILFGLQFRR